VLAELQLRSNERLSAAPAIMPHADGGGLVVFRWFGATAPRTLALPEQIAATVGDRIVAGEIAPGARVIEQDIAATFDTSRGPVREALRILEREGLVRIHPRRGARATQLSPQDVQDLFEIRAYLYQAIARRLAEQRPPEAIRLLEDGVRELRRLAEQPDSADAYSQLSFRLSLGSVRLAGNPRLADMITSLALQTYRYTRLGLDSRARRRSSAATWQASLVAIRDGDVATAMQMAEHRILSARAEVLRLLQAEAKATDHTPR
jgi:DNA-binding GntR family transcriptional regulator